MTTIVDWEKWENDSSYQISTAQSVVSDLDTIESYDAKVRFLEKLGFSPNTAYYVYKNGCRMVLGKNWQFVDENGNEIGPSIIISLYSTVNTDQDKAELNKAIFNYFRRYYDKNSKKFPTYKSPYAIKLFDELVSSYKERLNSTPIREEFIKGEIEKIDNKISQLPTLLSKAAKIAYNAILLIEPIEWSEINISNGGTIGHSLIFVWDLVEYQIYLRNNIEIEKRSTRNEKQKNDIEQGAVPKGWHFEPIFYIKQLIRYFSDKESTGQPVLCLRDVELGCFPGFNNQEVRQVLYTAEQMGYIVDNGANIYKINKEKIDSTLDKPVDVREVDLSRIPEYVHGAYQKAEQRLNANREVYNNNLVYYSHSERLEKLIEQRDMALQFHRQNKILIYIEEGAEQLINEFIKIRARQFSHFVYSPNCSLYNDEKLTPDKKLQNIIEAAVDRWYNVCLLNEMIDDFNKSIFKEKGASLSLIYSYKWSDDRDSLSELYNSFNEKMIFNTKKSDFISAFSFQNIESFNSIKWLGNASELIYFIVSLMPELIQDERKRMNWLRLKGCFVKSDGQQFTEDFKSLYQRLETDLSQSKKEAIDRMIVNFL